MKTWLQRTAFSNNFIRRVTLFAKEIWYITRISRKNGIYKLVYWLSCGVKVGWIRFNMWKIVCCPGYSVITAVWNNYDCIFTQFWIIGKKFFSESTEEINCPTPFKYALSSVKDESNAFPSETNCAFVAEYGRSLYSKASLEKNRSSSSSTTTGLNKKCILIPSFRDIGVIRSSTFGITNLIVSGNLFSAMTFLYFLLKDSP